MRYYIQTVITPRGKKGGKMMLRNLMAEMTRNNLETKDLANTIGRDVKSVTNKISCKTEFTRKEMVEIKKTHFPNLSLDYLFEQAQEG